VQPNEIGACVQVPDYDIARLRQNVVYTDNATNLESTSLPLPDFELGPITADEM
jgi:hypothetical protein